MASVAVRTVVLRRSIFSNSGKATSHTLDDFDILEEVRYEHKRESAGETACVLCHEPPAIVEVVLFVSEVRESQLGR